ncbi:shikimate synthase [Bdellovibrio sp. SKB1291214]|uniref:shikimate kinase n=1 Tax=Bdellovibrio sp. SKB1291214 TaxID=1732569 RepID=UPI000B51A469|nr:shikimate kinase [Bdellovibrio sp. SKB1291214]UYL08669.1 shikimate synthase [Bdellovibrio sp. SKB1291214]
MITLIIGHRGTGKSELVKRMQIAMPSSDVAYLDLDDEIEKRIGKTIRELFMEHGEQYFREMEKQMFFEVLQKPYKDIFLVLGAGFDVTIIPPELHVVWVKRQTDLDGRIFLNRPRLNPDMSPLQEYIKRASPREVRYQAAADEVYLMPEGIFEHHHQVLNLERRILSHQLQNISGGVTVLASMFDKGQRFSMFKTRYAGRGVDYFELRDDFLSDENILHFIQSFPNEKFIFSFRAAKDRAQWWKTEIAKFIIEKAFYVDWPLELGIPTEVLEKIPKDKIILSAHESSHFLDLQKLEGEVGHLKFAPLIESYKDLARLHQWQQEDDSSRSFLPRSNDGRWTWYRLRQKGHQLINFWREGDGSAGDQPSVFQWMMTPHKFVNFAAVLGDPVAHSFTPVEHSDFFAQRNIPVFAIKISRDEWNQAMPVLQEMGLQYAAVTAPHKEPAARWCHHPTLRAVNTLYFDKKQLKWIGTSTDEVGFLELIEGVGMLAPLQSEIAIWGGGGTLPMIEKVLPHATYYSSRTGEQREPGERSESVQPKVVIWAAPRIDGLLMPPTDWKPAMVFDLNYKEDSVGREYAQACGANYESGLKMFIAQAQQQRAFWKECEEKA